MPKACDVYFITSTSPSDNTDCGAHALLVILLVHPKNIGVPENIARMFGINIVFRSSVAIISVYKGIIGIKFRCGLLDFAQTLQTIQITTCDTSGFKIPDNCYQSIAECTKRNKMEKTYFGDNANYYQYNSSDCC